MSEAKMAPINFDNVEKVAAFFIAPDGLEMNQKMHELKQAGYDDLEIGIGAKMAIQACLIVIFGNGTENTLLKKFEPPKA
jgi:hypothetical protein